LAHRFLRQDPMKDVSRRRALYNKKTKGK